MMNRTIITLLTFLLWISSSFAQDRVWVKPYVKTNGTCVTGHWRTTPDSSPYNNYSYPGNYNPNTRKITKGSKSAYLNRYYGESKNNYSSISINNTKTTSKEKCNKIINVYYIKDRKNDR